MITEEQVVKTFDRANPIPNPEQLDLEQIGAARHLANLEQRSSEVTQLDTGSKDQTTTRNSRTWLIAAAVAVIVGVGAIVIAQLGEGDTEVVEPVATTVPEAPATTVTSTSDAGLVIEAYIAAYNSGDIEAVMALFTEQSTVTRHPYALEARGLEEIRSVHVSDLFRAAEDDAYTISNLVATGNTVTWDHLWVNDIGTQFCMQGHNAVIEDGKILTWTWPASRGSCP